MHIKSLSQKDRHGNMFSVEYFEPETSIPMMMVIPDMPDGYNGADTDNHPGDPKGTDTVPAWLTPGENVVNAEASRIPGNQEKIDQMNEEGRQIQKAQGGPIPTYESDGGFIQGLVDTFTLPKPPPGIEYRRHKDGSIGIWAGNIYRGKYKEPKKKESSFSKFLGVNYNYDGGSIPPMYANRGALAEFLKEEEGLRNEAYLDSAGVPTIGYGSTYGVKMGDKLSDAQANQQLMQDIAVAEEDYNNLVDVDLNPNQQNAVKSLLFNIGGPQFANSRARAALNAGDFDTFQKEASEFRMAGGEVLPGLEARRAREMDLFRTPYETADTDKDTGFSFIKSAQAADDVSNAQMLEQTQGPDDGTRGVPPVDQIPKNRELPIEKPSIVDPLIEGIPIGPGGAGITTADIASDIVNEDQITIKQNQDAIPVLESNLQSAKEEEAAAAKVINDKQAEGNPIYQDEILRHQEAKAKVSSLSKTVEKTKEETKIAQENVDQAVPPIQNYNTETGEFDIPEAKDKDIPDPSVQSKKDAAITEAMKNFRGKTFSQPSADELKEVERLGSSSQGEGIGTTVMGYFKDMFKDLFSGPELARMAVMYAGSRLMGYDHGGSLQYSMKQYIDRVDAANTQFQKDIRDDDYQNFTEESRKEFEETRDYSVLRKKKSAVTMEKPTGNSNLLGVGKVQRFLGTDGNEYVEYEGGFASVASLAGLLEPWDEDSQGREAVTADFTASFNSALEAGNRNNNLGAGNKGNNYKDSRVALETVNLARKAESRYREILNQNGVSVNDAPELKIKVNDAISKFVNDTIAFKMSGGKGTKPESIRAYINAETRSVLTGVPQFAMNGASEDNMNKLDDMIKKEVRDDEGNLLSPKDKEYAEMYENLWSATYEAYRLRSEYPDLDSQSDVNLEEVVEKKQERNKKKKDPANEWTPFTLWMSRTPWQEVQSIIEQAKLDGKL